MAEFCLKCFNKLNGTDYQANEVWLEEDFCEGCGDWKPCVFELRPKPLLWRLVGFVKRLLPMLVLALLLVGCSSQAAAPKYEHMYFVTTPWDRFYIHAFESNHAVDRTHRG